MQVQRLVDVVIVLDVPDVDPVRLQSSRLVLLPRRVRCVSVLATGQVGNLAADDGASVGVDGLCVRRHMNFALMRDGCQFVGQAPFIRQHVDLLPVRLGFDVGSEVVHVG